MCILCNIMTVDEFQQGPDPPKKNIFYCKTKRERNEFIRELCSDIVVYHPEVVKMINLYDARRLKNKK